MKLRLEATPDELREKSSQLFQVLKARLVGADPETAEPLEKAGGLPPKEPDLKYPVLRELKKQTEEEYGRTVKRMLKDIGKVLDEAPVAKSELPGLVFAQDPTDLSKGWLCGVCGAVSPGPRCEHVLAAEENLAKALYIGPRGGKWADPQHTIPWDPEKHGRQVGLALGPRPEVLVKPEEPKVEDVVQNDPILTEAQKAMPVSPALKEISKRIAQGDAAADPAEWGLPAGARIDDPWEPKLIDPEQKWSHPDYGEGKGVAPWQASDDWSPDLDEYDYIMINSSAGKDSQTLLAQVVKLAEEQGIPKEKLIVVHADLGRVDWRGTASLAKLQAEHYGLRFEVVRREDYDLAEQVEIRHGDLLQRDFDVALLSEAGILTWRQLSEAKAEDLLRIIGEGKGHSQRTGEWRAKQLIAQAKQKHARLAKKWEAQKEAARERIEKAELGVLKAKSDRAQANAQKRAVDAKKALRELEAKGDPWGWPIDFGAVIAWPSASARYCTRDHKTVLIEKLITQLAGEAKAERGDDRPTKILNTLGIRAQESDERAKRPNFEREKETRNQVVDRWFPIHRWHEKRVWETIQKSGVPFHKAYALGMRRLSCVFCVYATRADLMIAAAYNPELFQKYLEIEEKVGSSFKQGLSLREVAEEIRRRRDEGYQLNELAEWIKKAMGFDDEDLDLVKAVLDAPKPNLVMLILQAGLARLRRYRQEIEAVTIEWKVQGACVHLDTAVDSHHIAYLPYPDAYNASMLAATFAQIHGLGFEEHNEPSPLAPEELDAALQKALYIGPRGGKWADPEHTIPWDPEKHGKQVGMHFVAVKGKPLAEVEAAIYNQPVEHLAIFGAGGKALVHLVGDETSCRVPKNVVKDLQSQFGVTITHNHPRGGVLSADDISLAVLLDLKEMRAVGFNGLVSKIVRPESGWLPPSFGPFAAQRFQGLLEVASWAAIARARARMDKRIKDAGGVPGDEQDPAFDQEVYDEWFREEFLREINDQLDENHFQWRVEVEREPTRKSEAEVADPGGNAAEWGGPGQGLAPGVWDGDPDGGDGGLEKALYVGPRGGKWADPAHTIPWDPEKHGRQVTMQFVAKPTPQKTVEDIGPGTTLEEVQKILKGQPYEHIVFFVGNEYKQKATSHDERGVELDASEVDWLLKTGEAVTIHNHPSPIGFSGQDINVAVLTNCKETQVIASDGVLYRLVRPETGWIPGVDTTKSSLEVSQFQHKLQKAEEEGIAAAKQAMYFYIQSTGESPATAAHMQYWPEGKGFKEKYYQALSREVSSRFNEIGKEYGWKIEQIEPVLKSEYPEISGAEVWFELDPVIGEALWESLEKAGEVRPHKYIRRVPYKDAKGHQRYRYYYRESAAARAARVGEVIRLGDKIVTVMEIHDNGDISIHEGDIRPGQKVMVAERIKASEWPARLAGHYGEKFYEDAEKRARQAIGAVLKHVPRKMLADLPGDTDEARLEALKERVPEVYEKLQRAFQRAGVNPFEAKRILRDSLKRRGWASEARAAVIGNVLTLEGARLVRRHREILSAAENLAGGAQVGVEHAQAAVSLAQLNITQVAQRAETELVRLNKLLKAAHEDPTDMGKKAAVLAGAIASKAIEQLNALATAFPGLVDRAVPLARDTMLQVPSVAPGPPKKVGASASTYVAGEGGAPVALKTVYKLKEAEEVIPSHNPVTFSKNPDYPEDLQERAYHRDKAEQRKVITNAKRMETAFVANTNVDAVNGPPIIMKNGVVLGGNSRTMSMQRIYGDEAMADKAEEMKQYLRDHAYEFGLTPEDIDAMKNPILVREVEVEDQSMDNLKILVRAMNESFIQAMDPRTMQVAMGRRLSERALEILAETMDEGETLAEYLETSRARPFIQALHKAGIIDKRNESQYMRRGRLNADGKVMVARILAGRLLDDADMLSDTPHDLVESIAKAVPYMIKAAGAGATYDLRDTIHMALDAYNELQALVSTRAAVVSGRAEPITKLDKTVTDKDLVGLLSYLSTTYRTDLKEDHPIMADARAQAVLEVLIRRSGAKKLPNVFREYARLAAENPEDQPTLGAVAEVYTPEQVFRLAIQAAIDREAREAAEAAAKRAEKERRKKETEAQGKGLFDKADLAEPLINDFTKPIADKDERAYSRVKDVLKQRGYEDADFEEGGPLYGWGVNELIDLARDKRMD